MDKPPRFTSITCTACPVVTWQQMHDPTAIEGERQIRADERRLILREMQATCRDLQWLLDNLNRPDTPEKLRRHLRRLITLTERRSAA